MIDVGDRISLALDSLSHAVVHAVWLVNDSLCTGYRCC